MSTAAARYVEHRRGWRTGHTLLLGLIVAAIGVVGVSLPRSGGQLAFLGQRTVLAWLVIAALMAAFAAVAGHGVTGLARGVLIDERHRVTLGRLQMLIWTVLVLSAYLAAALANIGRDAGSPLNVNIPSELWLAMGISTASLVAAPAALAYKEKRHMAELQSWPSEIDSRFSDLFRGEEVGDRDHLDLGKVQMFLFTVVLVLAYGLAVGDMFDATEGTFTTLPPIDDGVVTLLAISHAGYLTRKALPISTPAKAKEPGAES
ncbi:MAG: hypothetical protein HOQ03_12805 [Thermoleophilia bacterium]|nr:hypothetical protein [Thermoleophilia bacterium]